MSYVPPITPNIVFDFSNEPAYTPPLSGAIEFSWKSILTSFTWLPFSRKYQIQIKWGEIVDAAYYSVSILKSGSNVDSVVSLQALSFESKGLEYDTEYQIVVEGKASDGTVIETKEATERTPVPIPNPPGSITSTIEATSVSLAWGSVNYATTYSVEIYRDVALIETKKVDALTCTFTGLENATDYVVQVTAENAQGGSEAREYVFKTLYFLPDLVTNIHQNAVYTLSVLAKWELPTNTAILQVEIEARKAGMVFFNRVYQGPRTEANISVLIEDTSVEVRVRANNPRGWSDWSAWVSLKSEPLVQPDAVLGLLAGAQQPEVQKPHNWTGLNAGDRGIIDEIGLNTSLFMFHFQDVNTSRIPKAVTVPLYDYAEKLYLGTAISIESRVLVKEFHERLHISLGLQNEIGLNSRNVVKTPSGSGSGNGSSVTEQKGKMVMGTVLTVLSEPKQVKEEKNDSIKFGMNTSVVFTSEVSI